MTKPNTDEQTQAFLQATREYLQRKTAREIENSIKALRERDPEFDKLCRSKHTDNG